MTDRKNSWKKEWQEFTAQPPGRRFRERFERRSTSGEPRPWWRKLLNIGIGLVLLAVGAFFAVAPGPAVIFFAVGGLLIAHESYAAAHLLDRIDVLLAPPLGWLQHRWHKLSPAARRLATICAVSGSVITMIAGILIMR